MFDNHAKVFYLSGSETSFFQFEMEVQFRHALEDTSDVFAMSVFVRGEDKEVVHIDDEPSFCDHVSEGVIHELLKSRWGIGESEEHHSWFKEAFMCDEGGLPLVAIFDANIVVPPADIKLGE